MERAKTTATYLGLRVRGLMKAMEEQRSCRTLETVGKVAVVAVCRPTGQGTGVDMERQDASLPTPTLQEAIDFL